MFRSSAKSILFTLSAAVLGLGFNSLPASAAPVVFNYTGAAESYVIPETGLYRIDVFGARGGANTAVFGLLGGLPAMVSGQVLLNIGTSLTIIVGQAGETPFESTGGGGGGSFVYTSDFSTLAAAGGGGGAGFGGGGRPAVTGFNGDPSADDPVVTFSFSGAGGIQGNGGQGLDGGGGGGFLGDGGDGSSNISGNVVIFAGGNGRSSGFAVTGPTNSGYGGFGGGGQAGANSGGGGGGFSGGGGGGDGVTHQSASGAGGGGGGSFLSENFTNTFRAPLATNINGAVTITSVPEPGTLSLLGLGALILMLRRRK